MWVRAKARQKGKGEEEADDHFGPAKFSRETRRDLGAKCKHNESQAFVKVSSRYLTRPKRMEERRSSL